MFSSNVQSVVRVVSKFFKSTDGTVFQKIEIKVALLYDRAVMREAIRFL